MNEDDIVVRDFLVRYPDVTVLHGPLYRVVDGQIMKGLHVVAHVQTGIGEDHKSWEGVGNTLHEALHSVHEQMQDAADIGPDGRRISEMSPEELQAIVEERYKAFQDDTGHNG